MSASAPAAATRSTVAVARKLAVLFWHLLTAGEDYAYGQPTLTHKKLRRMELTAGGPLRKGHRAPNPTGLPAPERREHERALAQHAETAYRQLVADRNNPNRPCLRLDVIRQAAPTVAERRGATRGIRLRWPDCARRRAVAVVMARSADEVVASPRPQCQRT